MAAKKVGGDAVEELRDKGVVDSKAGAIQGVMETVISKINSLDGGHYNN